MIVAIEGGPRLRITAEDPAVTFEGIRYEQLDLRPGDRVTVSGNRNGASIRATAIDTRLRVPDALAASLFPTHTIVGRFAVREAQTEFFMMNLAGDHYVRVDSRAAYGSKGRVRAGSLRPGDLLEVRGDWSDDKTILTASSIEVITDKEDSRCHADAIRGESKEDTAAREADEARFLQGTLD